MENQINNQQNAVNQIYEYAANLMVNQNKNASEIQSCSYGKRVG